MKKKLTIAGIIAAILVLAGVGFGVSRFMQSDRGAEAVEEEIPDTPTAEVPAKEPETESEKSDIEIPIDFEAIQAENPDAYAWIRIPGTKIDYPILQSDEDDLYYLNRSFEGQEDPAGSIFTQKGYNSKDMEDPNTVIYGHNMRAETMFHDLHLYEDRAFFDANKEVIIYLPGEIRTYRVFAAYSYDDRHILHYFDFQKEEVYQEYLDSIYAMRDMNSFVDNEPKVTTDDKIITLSTCDAVERDTRYLVQAVLVSIEN